MHFPSQGPDQVDVQAVDHRPIEHGNPEHIDRAGKTRALLPSGDHAGAADTEQRRDLLLGIAIRLSEFSKSVRYFFVVDLFHLSQHRKKEPRE